MATTLLLVVVQLVLLSVLGIAVLAPVRPERRDKLLPAAPVFGAVLIAVIANWTSRWLSVRSALPIILTVAAILVVYGVRKGNRPFEVPRRVWRPVALSLAACVGGFALAAAPIASVAGVSDSDVVAPAFIADGFYFGGVSTYLVDHPILPGPATDSSAGDDPPATAPAADTVTNRLRFGQSAVAAALSVLVLHAPYETVTSVSLLWLLLLSLATFVSGSLLGLRHPGAFLASLMVTSSFFVVAQPLQGQNDGLLGASFFLLALALSIGLLKDLGHTWPLVLVGAGLAATYSEYFILLLPALAALVVIGSRASLVRRLNRLGGCWAASVVLVPWAWVWLVQSFRLTTRDTDGPTPFAYRSGWTLFRAFLGTAAPPGNAVYGAVLTVVGLVVLISLCAGWAGAIAGHRSGGALVALMVVVGGLELHAVRTYAGNLEYRVLQLALPVLLIYAVVGWDLLLRRAGSPDQRARHVTRRRLMSAVALAAGACFVVSNLVTVGITTSYARAENQHLPASFLADVRDLITRVGPANVTVVAPVLTDVAGLSMALSDDPEVQYPAIKPSVYVGAVPHWDRRPDPYYVVGPGATVVGGATYLTGDGDYAIVQLHPSGMIITPFQGGWTRTTFMRGLPCARDGVQMVIIRGGSSPQSFRVALEARVPVLDGIRLTGESGRTLYEVAKPSLSDGRTIQTFRAPRALNSIVTIHLSKPLAAQGMSGVPLRFGSGVTSSPQPGTVDASLTDVCRNDFDSGMDGYDRDLTFMRAAP